MSATEKSYVMIVRHRASGVVRRAPLVEAENIDAAFESVRAELGRDESCTEGHASPACKPKA